MIQIKTYCKNILFVVSGFIAGFVLLMGTYKLFTYCFSLLYKSQMNGALHAQAIAYLIFWVILLILTFIYFWERGNNKLLIKGVVIGFVSLIGMILIGNLLPADWLGQDLSIVN